MEDRKKLIADTILSAYPELEGTDIAGSFENPKNPDFGDIALPCFRFAKIFRKPPPHIASQISALFENSSEFEKISADGGYLNFKYAKTSFAKSVLDDISDGTVFRRLEKEGSGKTMVIDFSSLNIAKEPHIGHLRSTIIGNSLYRLYRLLGWEAVRINHLGDWGTQFGKLIYAYTEWGDDDEFAKRPVRYLQDLYVRFHKEEEADPDLTDRAREWFLRLENGDEAARKLWEKFRHYTIEGIKKTYDRIGIEFDYYRGEGYYEQKSRDIIEMVENSGKGRISEGALIIDLEEHGMPPCIVRKSDGASIYSTRDLAAAIDRHEEFGFSKMIYVTELKQQLHFRQVFKALEILGYEWIKNAEHVGFGTILGISTRKGTVVYLEDIFDEARNRVLDIMKDREHGEEDVAVTADRIGIGAVIFQDLSRSRVKNIEFDWERVLSFEGETGPYIQYTYVRMLHIIHNAGIEPGAETDLSLLDDEASMNLIRDLSHFEKNLMRAYTESEPSVIASYLIELAKNFNRFYRTNRIMGVEKELMNARGRLVFALKDIFGRCMDILGIPIVDKM